MFISSIVFIQLIICKCKYIVSRTHQRSKELTNNALVNR